MTNKIYAITSDETGEFVAFCGGLAWKTEDDAKAAFNFNARHKMLPEFNEQQMYSIIEICN